jgi:hypothetical protein
MTLINKPPGDIEFNIQEGIETTHYEMLSTGENIRWRIHVDYGYDVHFTIRARSKAKGVKGSWIIFEPNRIISREGFIESSVLEQDGIPLPVVIEFNMDNRYSWFNSKHVVLGIERSMDVSISRMPSSPRKMLPGNPFPAPLSPDLKEMERLQASRTRIDLLWLNHVLGEAMLRCPASVPGLREKLSESKELIRKHVLEVSSVNVI